MDLKKTPLFDEHVKLGAKLAPFGGWNMPIQYTGIIAEHLWTRQNASLFDICHMGEFLVRGEPKKTGLDRVVTIDLDSMPAATCRYGFMLNDAGGIIDDLLVYKVAGDEWMLVVNASTTPGDEANLKKNLTANSNFANISDSLGKLDLQGPLSGAVLKDLIGPDVGNLRYYTFSNFKILDEDIVISRTGYTGELGYELYISNEKIAELWNLILKDKRVKPAGLGARDTLRLEMGYMLYGQDIDAATTPLEAGLEKFVDFKKDFIGRDMLLKQKKAGIARSLISFMADSRRSPRHNYKIIIGGRESGAVTSGSFSPSLECGIGMGYVRTPAPKAGSAVILKEGNVAIDAKIADRPFYRKGTAKN